MTHAVLAELLDIRYPIIQAPMAGGTTTAALIAAVSEAGGLGSLGAGYLGAPAIAEAAAQVRRLTERAFAINLFVPGPCQRNAERVAAANRVLDEFRATLGIARPDSVEPIAPDFEAQLEAALAVEPRAISTTFGALPADTVTAIRRRGIRVIGTATTVAEARHLAGTGVDAIVAQGFEAGGHRGSFLTAHEHSEVGLMALVPQMVDAVAPPVIASGAIMDGRGIAAAHMLGAAGVQMGSAFLACEESGAKPVHKQALPGALDTDTCVTRVFSGKPARGLYNRFMDGFAEHDTALPDYPEHNAWTKDVRAAAGTQGEPGFMSLWAGQAAGLARCEPAAVLMGRLIDEARAQIPELY